MRNVRRSGLRVQSAPTWNPQNVPDPKVICLILGRSARSAGEAQVMPSLELSLEESVRVQMDAVQNNDDPW